MTEWHIDFEYNQPAEAHMGLVSLCATDGNVTLEFWLKDKVQKEAAKCFLAKCKADGDVLVGYAVELAEGRGVYALGFDPNDFTWRDLMLEWRWLRNGDDRYAYGKVIQGLTIAQSTPPRKKVGKKATKLEREQAQSQNMAYALSHGYSSVAEAGKGLLDCLVFFGLCDKADLFRDLTQKNTTRQIIIEGSDEDLELAKAQILAYNKQDITKMPDLARILGEQMERVLKEPHIYLDQSIGQKVHGSNYLLMDEVNFIGGWRAIAYNMGEWAARCAKYCMRGLSLDTELLAKAQSIAEPLMDKSRLDYNQSQGWDRYIVDKADDLEARVKARQDFPADFDELMGWLKSKRNGRKSYPFQPTVWKESGANFQAWAKGLEAQMGIEWKLTDSGQLAADSKYLDQIAMKDGPIKAYLRQTKEIDAINGIKPGGKLSRTFGSDGIHRPAVDSYGTQTARNGQGASRFIFSAPHWFRAFIKPQDGYWYVDLDYSSQEIFIAGSVSDDANMLKTYAGGDPYWTYAQLTGAIPAELPVPSEEERGQEPFRQYKAARSTYKSVFLGVGFGMRAKALALNVSLQTGQELTKADGERFLAEYAEAYPDYTSYRAELQDLYYRHGYSLMLQDGWRMGNDNPTPNSVLNLPVQGMGTVILRKACRAMDAAGLYVVATMHDAVTLRVQAGDHAAIALAQEIMADIATECLGRAGMRVGNAEIVDGTHPWVHSEKAERDWGRFGPSIMAGEII